MVINRETWWIPRLARIPHAIPARAVHSMITSTSRPDKRLDWSHKKHGSLLQSRNKDWNPGPREGRASPPIKEGRAKGASLQKKNNC